MCVGERETEIETEKEKERHTHRLREKERDRESWGGRERDLLGTVNISSFLNNKNYT